LGTVGGTEFGHRTADVGFGCERAEVELVGDFVVGQAAPDEGYDLALANKAGPAILPPVAASRFVDQALTPDGKTLYLLDDEGHTVVPVTTATNTAG
jgi:hypothetical protein